jgi:hypothetical protein
VVVFFVVFFVLVTLGAVLVVGAVDLMTGSTVVLAIFGVKVIVGVFSVVSEMSAVSAVVVLVVVVGSSVRFAKSLTLGWLACFKANFALAEFSLLFLPIKNSCFV